MVANRRDLEIQLQLMRDLLGGWYIDHSGPLQSITDQVTHVVTQCMDIVTQEVTNVLTVNSYSQYMYMKLSSNTSNTAELRVAIVYTLHAI